MRNVLNKLLLWLNQRIDKIGAQYIAFGIFGVINYPGSYIFWRNVLPPTYNPLSLRLIAAILCIPLILKNYWPKKFRLYLPAYWYVTVLYCLPFFGTYLLLMNHVSNAWLMNLVLGLFLFISIVDWFMFILLLTLGAGLGWLAYWLTSDQSYSISLHSLSFAIYMYFFAFLIGFIFFRGKEKLATEKRLQLAKALAATIAHEFRTPLSSINAAVEGIKEYWPDLLHTYTIAKSQNLSIPSIRMSELKELETILYNIQTKIHFANTIINMILINVGQSNIRTENFKPCSVIQGINEALNQYPFSGEEKTLIYWDNKQDFLYYGEELLTIHVLFNLLKNALYYIKVAGKGNIHIWVEQHKRWNELHFRDTGSGIGKDLLSKIFDRFFSETYHGTGIGLSFCKMVMQAYHGDIICRSIEGEYTEFILTFPIYHNNK